MDKLSKEEQKNIIQALTRRLRKEIMYDESDNKFYESPVGLFWTEIPEKIVDEVINELGIKILEKENQFNEKKIKEDNKQLVSKVENGISETVSLKNNKCAIIGFVLSLISIFGVGLAGIVGMIFGIVALNQIKYTKERGKGLAITAIIIGFVWGFGIGILRQLVEMGF